MGDEWLEIVGDEMGMIGRILNNHFKYNQALNIDVIHYKYKFQRGMEGKSIDATPNPLSESAVKS